MWWEEYYYKKDNRGEPEWPMSFGNRRGGSPVPRGENSNQRFVMGNEQQTGGREREGEEAYRFAFTPTNFITNFDRYRECECKLNDDVKKIIESEDIIVKITLKKMKKTNQTRIDFNLGNKKLNSAAVLLCSNDEAMLLKFTKDFFEAVFEKDPDDPKQMKVKGNLRDDVFIEFVVLKRKVRFGNILIPEASRVISKLYLEKKILVKDLQILEKICKKIVDIEIMKLVKEIDVLGLFGESFTKELIKMCDSFNFAVEILKNSVKMLYLKLQKIEKTMRILDSNIEKIAERKYSDIKKKFDRYKCVICFERMIDCAPQCGHLKFCMQCLIKSMSKNNGECPICKAKIKSINQIFNEQEEEEKEKIKTLKMKNDDEKKVSGVITTIYKEDEEEGEGEEFEPEV